ncbi:hypothetical protein KC19_1G114900 [Ceratodon purpureus]|uniref:Ubiquitin thioesterase OTU n=1 Tax=Ceratodon purpureus TaxID=3225 RepID=A0A8T0J4S7_CERPU|nr:hypothetical protein KC19_1G114900 [Ceratodon purpureus]
MTSDLKGHMLGPVCCRLSAIGKSSSIRAIVNLEGPSVHTAKAHLQQSAKVALPPLYPSSPRAHSFKLVTRAPATASLPRTLRRSSSGSCKSRQDVSLPPNQETCGHMLPCTSMTSFHNHSSSCILAGDGKVGATIWHALLPARHLASLEWDANLSSIRSLSVGRGGIDPVASMMIGSSDSTSVDNSSKSLGILRSGALSVDNVGLPRLGSLSIRSAMAGCLSEGSWNAAWDARPARWLHGRHSAWLLFGVCACFSAAAAPLMNAASSPVLTEAVVDNLPQPNAVLESEKEPSETIAVTPQTEQSGHGKEIFTDYTVTGIPGDGRCLFRAVAHGSCLRSGKEAPDENAQRELADELRSKVADELIKRRDSTEWFIEGDFDQYVERMRQTYVWGGEPELLMLSHVLEMPITVYMTEEKTKKGLIAIAEYGQEYSKIDPIQVLYHGFGHYEALQIPSNKVSSRL